MVAYVHIEDSTYQFSEESYGTLRYRKNVVLRGLTMIQSAKYKDPDQQM